MAEKNLCGDDILQANHGSEGMLNAPSEQMECAVCLQACMHPVRLPCDHIFCFLCVKGVAIQSKRCALCRKEIPVDYFNNPILVKDEDLNKDTGFDDGHWWYYEGRNGWWQYDERTSMEIEERYKQGAKSFELLIAGFLYILDLDNMVQYRRNDPFRRRRVKRDHMSIPKKGVAGLKITSPVPQRSSGDGGERGGARIAQAVMTVSGTVDANANGQLPRTPDNTPASSRAHATTHNAPHNTPLSTSPHTAPLNTGGRASPHNPPLGTGGRVSPGADLTAQMSQISLNPRSGDPNNASSDQELVQYPEDSDSSDGDWS